MAAAKPAAATVLPGSLSQLEFSHDAPWLRKMLQGYHQMLTLAAEHPLASGHYVLRSRIGRLRVDPSSGKRSFVPGVSSLRFDVIEARFQAYPAWSAIIPEHEEHAFRYRVGNHRIETCLVQQCGLRSDTRGGTEGSDDGDGKRETHKAHATEGTGAGAGTGTGGGAQHARPAAVVASAVTKHTILSRKLIKDVTLPVKVGHHDCPIVIHLELSTRTPIDVSYLPIEVAPHQQRNVQIRQTSSFELRGLWEYRIQRYWHHRTMTLADDAMGKPPTYDVCLECHDVRALVANYGHSIMQSARAVAVKLLDALFLRADIHTRMVDEAVSALPDRGCKELADAGMFPDSRRRRRGGRRRSRSGSGSATTTDRHSAGLSTGFSSAAASASALSAASFLSTASGASATTMWEG